MGRHVQDSDDYEIIWQTSIGLLIEPATLLIEAISEGLEHAGLQLELIPRPAAKGFTSWLPGFPKTVPKDLEAEKELDEAARPQFSQLLEQRLTEFSVRRSEALMAWANSEGLSASQADKLQDYGSIDEAEGDGKNSHVLRDHQQLYLLLYVQHLVSKNGLLKHV